MQDLTEKTTHLVAIRKGTAKANAAKKNPNIKIVNPDWLWSCAERWEHVDERLFPLTSQVLKIQWIKLFSTFTHDNVSFCEYTFI